jgi:hypothetical protein
MIAYELRMLHPDKEEGIEQRRSGASSCRVENETRVLGGVEGLLCTAAANDTPLVAAFLWSRNRIKIQAQGIANNPPYLF